MPGEFALPYLEVEALVAVINRRDARDMAHPLFGLFPRVGQTAQKIKIRYDNRRPAEVRHTTWGGRAVPIDRGEIKEREAEPAVLKVFDTITAEDAAMFAKAAEAKAANQVEGIGGAAIMDANERIRRLGADLGDNLAEERHRLMVGACQGSVSFLVYDSGVRREVSYGLPTIAAPSTHWDDPAALIVQDIESAIKTFRANNPRGLSPDTVLYSPDITSDYLVGNEQWQDWIKLVPSMAQGFLRVPGGRNPFDIQGGVNEGIFGLNWVKIEGTYMARDATTNALTPTARWPVNKLTFLNVRELGAQWKMVVHPWFNPTAEVNVEVKEPQKGDDVKAAIVTAFDNGLPYFADPTLIQTWDVNPS